MFLFLSLQVNNISLNDKTVAQDVVNNNGNGSSSSGGNDSNNNADEERQQEAPKATTDEVKSSSRAGRVTRSSSATPKVPPRRARMTITAQNAKTQGDELNEIKATRRRHTRSHNLDNS